LLVGEIVASGARPFQVVGERYYQWILRAALAPFRLLERCWREMLIGEMFESFLKIIYLINYYELLLITYLHLAELHTNIISPRGFLRYLVSSLQ
jgi:hypothetical protein